MEQAARARVFCSRCKEQIGRIQTVPESETGDEAETRRRRVQDELTLRADEHRAWCSGESQ